METEEYIYFRNAKTDLLVKFMNYEERIEALEKSKLWQKIESR